MDIAEFLEARWAEAEYHAKVALLRAKPPWSSSETPESGPPGAVSLYDADDDNFAIIRGSYLADYLKRFDPAAVLADIEAKRAILAEHAIDASRIRTYPFDPFTGKPNVVGAEVNCAVCGWASIDPTSGCRTLRLLAVPFASHPDYDPSWRPEA